MLFAFPSLLNASSETHDEKETGGFNVGEVIFHHIQDSYDWHLMTINGEHISIPLPIILYIPGEGFDLFLSSAFHHGIHNGFTLHHGKIVHEQGKDFYDVSITKNVASMLLSAIILLVIFLPMASKYKKGQIVPKGIQGLLEPVIVFVRDEIAKPSIGHKYEKFMPFLLSVFFFIWLNDLMGLLPLGANVTGNIAVTMCLALFTFVIVNINGNKNYWAHIFAPPGVPVPLYPIMWAVEILGLFVKPIALMIRLFANVSAGHIVILSLISLIFMFAELSKVAGYGVSVVSVAFALFIYCLELLVAVLQAYIFTMLSAVFIGQAVEEHH